MANRHRHPSMTLAALALATLLVAVSAHATEWRSSTFILDNDFFTLDNKDRYYTNGLHYRLESKPFKEFNEENTPKLLLPLTHNRQFFPETGGTHSIAYQVGQLMYTPSDIKTTTPSPTDLPYAGILYGMIDLRTRTAHGQENWSFMIGVIGPMSRADAVQRYVHAQWGIDTPNGWDTQLGNELLLNIMREQRFILGSGQLNDSFNYRFASDITFQIGNYDTSAGTGIGVLLTENPMRSHGGQTSSHADRTHFDTGELPPGAFFFAGTQVRMNVWTAVVNGTLHQPSGLTPKPFSIQFIDGFGYSFTHWSFAITWHRETRRFTTQKSPMYYGSVVFNYRF